MVRRFKSQVASCCHSLSFSQSVDDGEKKKERIQRKERKTNSKIPVQGYFAGFNESKDPPYFEIFDGRKEMQDTVLVPFQYGLQGGDDRDKEIFRLIKARVSRASYKQQIKEGVYRFPEWKKRELNALDKPR